MIILRKLAERQESQRALKIKNRILKQTHDIKLAESLSPITEKFTEIKESTKIIGEVIKDSNYENESNQEIVPVEIESEDENIQTSLRPFQIVKKISTLMTETLGALMNSKISLKLIQDDLGRASILGIHIYTKSW